MATIVSPLNMHGNPGVAEGRLKKSVVSDASHLASSLERLPAFSPALPATLPAITARLCSLTSCCTLLGSGRELRHGQQGQLWMPKP